MKRAKAILFDLDGTLIDSEICHYHCWDALVGLFGHHLDHNLYMEQYSGVSVEKNAARLVKQYALDVSIQKMIEMREELMLKTFRDEPIERMPYADEIINYYRRLNVPLALVTSSSAEEVEVVLGKLSMCNIFDKIVSRTDVNHSKPHPEPYQLGLELLGFNPNECIVIEDTMSGVQSAKAAGLDCIAVQATLFDEFKQAGLANAVCRDLQEVQRFISDNYTFS